MKRGLPAIMHGDGSYVRSWLHVEDTVDAVMTIIEKGERNTIYNVGSDIELRNIDVLRRSRGARRPGGRRPGSPYEDRSGQDVRYSLDDSRLRALGWAPKRHFDEEIARTSCASSTSRGSPERQGRHAP